MTPVRLYLDGIAFRAPGIADWCALRSLFGAGGYAPGDDWQIVPDCLSPRAARRVSPQIRLALAVAEQVAPAVPDGAGWVFASSVGEGETLQVILEALREPDMMIQPLRFQNAVHNAASGQWSIAAGVTAPITSIAAYDGTVGAGFLKSALTVAREDRPAALVLYDFPLPEPLNAKRPLGLPLGAGFALSPRPGPRTLAAIDVGLADAPVTAPQHDVSQQLTATGNPVARMLPLAERIACGESGTVFVGVHGGGSLRLDVAPA